MTMFPLTDCCAMLAIDPKTLRHWLQQADMPLHIHPTDARIKCLTSEQVYHLAALHGHPIQPRVSALQEPVGEASALHHLEKLVHLDRASVLADKTGAAPLLEDADVIKKLSSLETQVVLMQQQLAQLALELLQERELRFESRLRTLEGLIQQTGEQQACRQEIPPLAGDAKPDAQPNQGRRLHPAEQRARSRALPLIEYGAHGSYVMISPPEGALHLTPDSAEWFDWLA